ncbi:zinc finger protein 628-like isoform X3 [Portunus trituberculatus]|uniref:zinc finger protein 628-like isoform X3 n=1 Tax=Portunus trituberculatus TaxID=210409 RepID=UPI001E1CB7AF|nr:zinc finger protein 628-like isoform X3 [Portunus trituberculatus]
MASEEKILQVGEAQETPQAITITIVDPSALGSTSLDPSLVAQGGADQGSIVMVSGAEDSKAILQTVTETHMGTEELPIISNISNPEEEEMIVHETKLSESFDGGGEEGELGDSYEDVEEPSGPHCLVCNIDLTTNDSDEQVPVFKTQTSTTQRKVAVFLSSLIGQKVTSRKAHSDILCRRCFSLLDRVDSLEVEIRETKEEIINKYQETVSVYGGRARRIKPATAKKPDYVFPKVEPEDEADQLLDMELDGNFEPQVEDLMDEDPSLQDDDWEPKFKRPRIKKESTSIGVCESSDPPKRKRGRPRKDLTKAKDTGEASEMSVSVKANEDTEQEGKTPRPPPCADPQPEIQDSNVLTSHLVDGSLTCGCGVKSTSEAEHVEHVLTHVGGAFRCPQCDCSYTSSPLLARHQRLVHSPDGPRGRGVSSSLSALRRGSDACRCGEAVGGDLLGHARVHLTGREECPVCGIRLVTARALEIHVERKHSPFLIAFLKDEEAPQEGEAGEEDGCVQPVRCDVCGKVVSTTSRLARHRYLHHSEHYPWPCAACTLAFPSPNARRLHICPNLRKKDGEESSTGLRHECSICNVVFKLAPSLGRHMRRAHGIETAPFSCPVCSRAMASRKALTDHLRCHRRQGFPCEFCGAKLKTVDSLNVHVNEIHTHVVRFQCKLCPQVFFSSGRLSYHMKRQHTDRRSYTNLCHLCGKAYPYPSELRLHLRSHRNERPYKCDQCQKTFLKQGDLTYHKRSHTGERPHKCPHCDARFPRPNTLRSHIRYQHRETVDVGTVTTAAASTTSTTTTITTTTITSTTTTSVSTTTTTTANITATTAVTANSVATTITAASTNITEAPTPTTTVAPYVPGAPAADSVVSSAPYLTTVNAAGFPTRPSAVAVMTVPGGVPRAPAPPTLVPVVEGQLVNTVVGGHMTEMQPVQYVQVDGLPGGQAVQAVPHTVQGLEYAEAATLPYQIVHLQILQ